MDGAHQFGGVPIGQAKTTERFGPADFFGRGGSMDAKAGTIETNPGHTHGIVGARGDAQSFADGGGLGIVRE